MGYHLLLTNGTIVDGMGSPSFRADIGIVDGKIVDIGQLKDATARRIDIEGLVAAPGVVDPHSHYDAMVCWDGLLDSSSEHGTTTVIQGNCGIGVAPCRPRDREDVLQELVAIEGMSYDVLSNGIQWNFETFPEYLAHLRRRGLGINLGALVPLSTLRRYTLGDDASERAATASERSEIARNLRLAMESGAIGFSASFSKFHSRVGIKGRSLPSRMADRDELVAYAGVLREVGRGVIQAHVLQQVSSIADDEIELLELLSESSGGRPVTYSGAYYRPDDPEAIERMLQRAEPLRRRGIRPQSTIRPLTVEVDFRRPYIFSGAVAAFKQLQNTPLEEQKRMYRDPAWRAEASSQMADGKRVFGETWIDGTIFRVAHETMRPYLLKTVREIAKERGRPPFDTMLDLALEDDLELKMVLEYRNSDPKQLREHIKDPRLLIGLADGGAHVDMLFESSYPTYMLGHWVREQQAIPLEHAVARMTSEPADFFGLKDRGRLAPGMAADLMIFNPDTVGSPKKADQVRHDLPGGGVRLFASPTGMEYVIVNGQVVYDHNRHTGAMPGQIVDGR